MNLSNLVMPCASVCGSTQAVEVSATADTDTRSKARAGGACSRGQGSAGREGAPGGEEDNSNVDAEIVMVRGSFDVREQLQMPEGVLQ
jgi:hypothetical protein